MFQGSFSGKTWKFRQCSLRSHCLYKCAACVWCFIKRWKLAQERKQSSK